MSSPALSKTSMKELFCFRLVRQLKGISTDLTEFRIIIRLCAARRTNHNKPPLKTNEIKSSETKNVIKHFIGWKYPFGGLTAHSPQGKMIYNGSEQM
jgi:hypothetical protein